jgi:hypothetical protein
MDHAVDDVVLRLHGVEAPRGMEACDGGLGGDDGEILYRDEQWRVRKGLGGDAQHAAHHRLARHRHQRLVADAHLRGERIER